MGSEAGPCVKRNSGAENNKEDEDSVPSNVVIFGEMGVSRQAVPKREEIGMTSNEIVHTTKLSPPNHVCCPGDFVIPTYHHPCLSYAMMPFLPPVMFWPMSLPFQACGRFFGCPCPKEEPRQCVTTGHHFRPCSTQVPVTTQATQTDFNKAKKSSAGGSTTEDKKTKIEEPPNAVNGTGDRKELARREELSSPRNPSATGKVITNSALPASQNKQDKVPIEARNRLGPLGSHPIVTELGSRLGANRIYENPGVVELEPYWRDQGKFRLINNGAKDAEQASVPTFQSTKTRMQDARCEGRVRVREEASSGPAPKAPKLSEDAAPSKKSSCSSSSYQVKVITPGAATRGQIAGPKSKVKKAVKFADEDGQPLERAARACTTHSRLERNCTLCYSNNH